MSQHYVVAVSETYPTPHPTYTIEPASASRVVEQEVASDDAERVVRVVVQVSDRGESLVMTQFHPRAPLVPVMEDIAFWSILALPPDLVRTLAGEADAGEAVVRLSRLVAPLQWPWSNTTLTVDGRPTPFARLEGDDVTVFVSLDDSVPAGVVDRGTSQSPPTLTHLK